jgi:biopolymer transport protein ExbD
MKADLKSLEAAGNLRLPVPFFDLFMVLLICFMMFLSPAPTTSLDTGSIDIPMSRKQGETDAAKLFPVTAHQVDKGWVYEPVGDGRRLAARELADRARSEGKKVILVVAASVSLQRFVEMQNDLRDHQVEFGLAVKEESKR